jgi:oxygen-dependent protoporphyrinogen oxidase
MNVAVLGAGVTGLTAAWRLSKAGHKVRLLEAGPRVGGAVSTDLADGWLVEAGPTSLVEGNPQTGAFIGELGLGPERIESSPVAKHRYIAKNGKLVALPEPKDAASLVSTPLLSFGSKLRVSSEVTKGPRARTEDASVADFVRDHFGSEVLERVVQPFIGGIYAGDAERLSARLAFPKIWEAEKTTGSLIRAGMESAKKRRALGLDGSPAIVSFRRGLQALTDALAAQLPQGSVTLGAEVRSLGPGPKSRWLVAWDGRKGPESGMFDCVVSALPAWSLARMEIGGPGRRPLSGLGAIEYPPVASVFLGFRRDRVAHPLDGFGALVPASEKRSVLGVIFSSSLFAGRAPPGHVALTAFAGGALQPEIARLPDTELIGRVCADLEALVGAQGRPAFARHTLWPRAIPQYNLGYGAHLDAMEACERAHPGLLIGGNVRDGISLPDCIASGTSLAKRVS